MNGLPSPIKCHIYTGQHIPTAHPYAYLLAANGLYKLVDTPHFYASLRIAPARVAGLCKWPEEGVLLRVPRIPLKWLRAALDHARHVAPFRNGQPVARPVEQMYHFHAINGGWAVSVPKQQATPGRVRYAGGSEPTIALDLHSHHEMSAFFSGTDNGDALGCRFDAVIGRIYTRPEIRVRLALYGDWLPVPALGLFEELGEFTDAALRQAQDGSRRVVNGASLNVPIDEEYG